VVELEDCLNTSVVEFYNATAGSYDQLYRDEQFSKYAFLQEKSLLAGFKRVLDAGCGTALLFDYMTGKEAGDFKVYVCMDASEGMIREALSKVRDPRFISIVAFIEETPVIDDYFDIAYSITVWDNLEDKRRALSELKRVAHIVVVSQHYKSTSPTPASIDPSFQEIGFRVDRFFVYIQGDK
jgi:ubiquinone/menaquinone biosynthesis C-methylase UbiE